MEKTKRTYIKIEYREVANEQRKKSLKSIFQRPDLPIVPNEIGYTSLNAWMLYVVQN